LRPGFAKLVWAYMKKQKQNWKQKTKGGTQVIEHLLTKIKTLNLISRISVNKSKEESEREENKID
jgi:heme/copper-type cytochrome/quinol oxidase subunit 3